MQMHAAGRRTAGALAVVAAVTAAGAGLAGARSPKAGTVTGLAKLPAGTRLFGVAAEPDGGSVAVGESGAGKSTRLIVARFTAGGGLDRHFGRRGIATGPAVRTPRGTGSLGRAVAVEGNGKIVVVGTATDRTGTARQGLLVERFNASGSLDRSFGSHGVVNALSDSFGDGYAVALQPGGDILAAGAADAAGSGNGSYPRSAVVRLNGSGRPIGSFGRHGVAVNDLGPYSYALAVASASGGRVVIAGSQSPNLQATNALLARLSSTGRVQGSYAHQYARGAAYSAFNAVAVTHGQIVAAGSATGSGQRAYAIAAKFSGSGRPVGSFGPGGVAYATSATQYLGVSNTTPPGATSLALGPRGELILAGRSQTGVVSTLTLWAFSASGHPVNSFGKRGVLLLPRLGGGQAAGVAIARGTAVVAGDTNQFGSHFAGLLARIQL